MRETLLISLCFLLATPADAGRYLGYDLVPPGARLIHRYPNGAVVFESDGIPPGGARALPELSVALSANSSMSPREGLHIVQFVGPIEQGWRDRLTGLGVEILDYLPHDAYLCWLDPTSLSTLARDPIVRGVRPLDDDLKLTREVRARMREEGLLGTTILVALRPSPDFANVLRRLGEIGRIVRLETLLGQEIVRLSIAPTRIREVAAEPEVISISPWSPSAADGEIAKRIIDGSSGLGPGVAPPGYRDWLVGKGLSGSGVTVAVIDSGIADPDPSGHLTGRVTRVARGASPGSDGHGHHVAGIIGGDCNHPADPTGYLWGIGVAPAVGLVDIPRLRPGYTGSDREQARDAVRSVAPNGVAAVVASCSWNAGLGGDYTLIEREWDAFTRDADELVAGDQPLLFSFSSGNAGAGRESLTRPHAAKNVITVGNSRSHRPSLGRSDFNLIEFTSSRGPTADGRIKPDVVAPGTDIASAWNGSLNCSLPFIDSEHTYCTGTSMSQPHAAGGAALFVEWWARVRGARPSPALLKAALINGARDLLAAAAGPPLGTGPVPNSDEGWGLIDLDASIAPAMPTLYFDQSTLLDSPGDRFVVEVVVADPSQPLRATLTWTDAPGAVGADPALVNDLDLSISGASERYLGNGFAEGWSSSTVTVADDRNNVENVFLRTPIDEVQSVAVLAVRLPGDGVPSTGDATDQDFAMVIHNAEVPVQDGKARILGGVLRCGSRAELLVWDSGESGPVTVTVLSTTEPLGESVSLASTQPGSKLFRGGIDLASGLPAADGRLQVSDGDTVEVRFLDSDDGKGGFGILKSGFAMVDCRPPVVSGVRATSLSDRSVQIDWLSDEPTNGLVRIVRPMVRVVTEVGYIALHQQTIDSLEECLGYAFEIEVADRAGNLTVADNSGVYFPFRTLKRQFLFAADFELNDGGFTHRGSFEEWEWGAALEGPMVTSGDRLWGTDLDGKYAKGGRSPLNGHFLLISPELDLGTAGSARLRLQRWHELATDGDTDDGAWLELWDGARWRELTPEGGYHGTVDSDAPAREFGSISAWAGDAGGDGAMVESDFDLGAYSGMVRFKLQVFEEDSVLAGAEGLYVDDIEVYRFGSCDTASVALRPGLLNCSGTVQVDVRDAGLDRDPIAIESIDVVVASTAERGGETIRLVESAASSGRFAGTIATAVGPPGGDGLLQVAGDDRVALVLRDDDDGSGRAGYASADVGVDCRLPQLGGVQAVVGAEDAWVFWRSDEPATSAVRFGPDPTLTQLAEDRSLVRSHAVRLTGLSPCTTTYFSLEGSDSAANRVRLDDGGQPFRLNSPGRFGEAFADDFERDRGWLLDGEWERGHPLGHRLVTPSTLEPNAAVSGRDVIGVDLLGSGAKAGRYEPGVARQAAVSPMIDLGSLANPNLQFARWLGVDRAPLDDARIEGSIDGGMSWSTLWSNPTTAAVNDRLWTAINLPLSAYVGARDFRLRFSMASDAAIELMGFQLDDVLVVDPALPRYRACGSELELRSVRIDDSLGDGDGMVEPGETITIAPTLSNSGVTTARGIAVELRSGFGSIGTVVRGSATTPDLAPGASSETLAPHFELAVDPCAVAGKLWPLDLSVSCLDSGSNLGITLPIGGSLSSNLWSSPGVSRVVPDGDPNGLVEVMEVAQQGLIGSIEVGVELSHLDASELFVSLTAPDGTHVVLHSGSGSGSPYSARVYPPTLTDGPGSLGDLVGREAAGAWQLSVVDALSGGVGNFDRFTLRLGVHVRRLGAIGALSDPLRMARRGDDVALYWGAAVGASGYRVERSADRRLVGAVPVTNGSSTSTADPGAVRAAASFFYRVHGLDACGREGP